MRYNIVRAADEVELERVVNELTQSGWTPLGGPVFVPLGAQTGIMGFSGQDDVRVNGYWVQAMTGEDAAK